MAYDFAVKWDPSNECEDDLNKRILYSLILKRIKHKKPVVIFISGDSGEGKSYTALRLQEMLMEMQGLKLSDYIEDINVFTPFEYPHKLKALLFDKRLNKVNIICMQEARDVVKAKNWQSFLTQAIADVNAMSRSVKRLVFIIVSQFIRDITTDVRYTLTYYGTVNRPLGERAKLSLFKMWKNDYELERPKLVKVGIRGLIKVPENKKANFCTLSGIEMGKPNKENRTLFDKLDYEAKAKVIHAKMEKLIQQMELENDLDNQKVKVMVDWYIKHPQNISLISKKYRGKLKLLPDVKKMHNLTDSEVAKFQDMLLTRMKNEGMADGTDAKQL